MEDTAVLIVGGGLSGLSSAVFLAWRGVPVIVVERHSGTLLHPRARSINPRTAELMRQVGLEEAIRGARGYVRELPAVTMLRVETLAGAELGRTTRVPPRSRAGVAAVSPSTWGMIDQDELEVLLRASARQLGADVRFSTELTSFSQDATGVTATVRDLAGAGERTIRARYLIAADGRAGRVRRRLGIGEHGQGTLGHIVSMVFDADLSGPLRGRHDPARDLFIASCHLSVPAEGTVLFPYGTGDRWVFHTPYDPAGGQRLDEFGDAYCSQLIRAAIGVSDLSLTLIPQLADGTKVLGYEIAAAVADRFRSGRVFLVGDAAHVMPPAGAFGAGTGIQDAHNLAWKLAAVLAGHADVRLLDSYDEERRPVALFTKDQALLQMRERTGHATEVSAEPADYDAVVFGYHYRSAVITPDDDLDGRQALAPHELTGQPGTRAPHVVIGHGRSSLDLYGTSHVLLAGPAAPEWAECGRSCAQHLGVPLDVYRAGTDVIADTEGWCAAHGISARGCVIVRPDGFVAWRSDDSAQPSERLLDAVLTRSLGGRPALPILEHF